jgi:dTDP-4-dehydrorhamnose reductase
MTRPILLFGATSILGYSLARQFPERIEPYGTPGSRAGSMYSWPAINLEDPLWASALFQQQSPDILIYGHAVCDVPKCQDSPEWARRINVGHVRHVLSALPPRTRMVYVSSDHVFGGDGIYDEGTEPCPISVYGRTRVDAERLVLQRSGSLVIRVGLPIGPSPNGRTGHGDWLRYRSDRNLPITIVSDEYRSAVWADHLACRVLQLADSTAAGIRHVAATRVASRIELANHLLSLLEKPAGYLIESRRQRSAPHLGHVELSTIYNDSMARPLMSVLDNSSVGNFGTRDLRVNHPAAPGRKQKGGNQQHSQCPAKAIGADRA